MVKIFAWYSWVELVLKVTMDLDVKSVLGEDTKLLGH